jgi:hypothetical protein
MSEHRIQNEIRNALAGECLLFRANVGRGWTGSQMFQAQRVQPVVLQPGDVVIRNARPFDTGLPTGFGDTFGLATRIITERDLGTKLGVYIAGEIKYERGRASEKQAAYLRAVNDNGGAADVWRSVADALATVARAKGKV